MVVIHKGRIGHKPSGGTFKQHRSKRKYEIGSTPTLTNIGQRKVITVRTKGNNVKSKVLLADSANIYDPKTKKYSQSKIKTVVENPANRHYVRRNIITKGTIIDTDLGKARVSCRPGQDGCINAVLVK